jgi:hypothetical protein
MGGLVKVGGDKERKVQDRLISEFVLNYSCRTFLLGVAVNRSWLPRAG